MSFSSFSVPKGNLMIHILHEIHPTKVTIKDFPCGSGKTTKMLQNLHIDKLYLIVVPYKSEIIRVLDATRPLGFEEPLECMTDQKTKRSALIKLIGLKKSIVTTHSLYNELGKLAAEGLFREYNIIIDEVPEIIKSVTSLSKTSLTEFYINTGYLDISEEGLCIPTAKWFLSNKAVSDTLNSRILAAAEAANLFVSKQGTFFRAIPTQLFFECRTLTVLTYQASGSYLIKFLEKFGISYVLEFDELEEKCFRNKAKRLITILDSNALAGLNFTYAKQIKHFDDLATMNTIRSVLKNLRTRQMQGVSLENLMVTCAEDNWRDAKAYKAGKLVLKGFSKGTGLGKANWVSNQTRGTNKYSHCSHLIYLYDKHPVPPFTQWLGCSGKQFSDQYALTELIQWIWRSRIRNNEPITLFIPSIRMKRLLLNWLNS